MARTLKALINAGAFAPWASSESFDGHVPGSASSSRMSYYNLTAWEFSGGVPAPETTYTVQTDFAMDVAFTQGSHAGSIKRTGAVITVEELSWPLGASVTLIANDVVSGATGSTVTCRVVQPYSQSATAVANSGWFDGYSSPNNPPGEGPDPVTMYHSLNGAGGSGTQHVTWYLRYQPDQAASPGPYNPMLSAEFDAHMNNRAEVVADWEFQWYTEDTYTNLVASTPNHTFQSSAGEVTTFWTKARRIGSGGGYGNLGPISFTDPREPL